jgi:hypothetical protein
MWMRMGIVEVQDSHYSDIPDSVLPYPLPLLHRVLCSKHSVDEVVAAVKFQIPYVEP